METLYHHHHNSNDHSSWSTMPPQQQQQHGMHSGRGDLGRAPGSATRKSRTSEDNSRAASDTADSEGEATFSVGGAADGIPPAPPSSSGTSGTALAPSSQQQQQQQQKPKRKKATRACNACQKAHLTCDDSRPCQRCIKRDLADSCQDGKRKKAKYLQDYADEVLGRRAENPVNQKLIQVSHNGAGVPSQQEPLQFSSSSNGNSTAAAEGLSSQSQQQPEEQIPAFSHSSLLDSPRQHRHHPHHPHHLPGADAFNPSGDPAASTAAASAAPSQLFDPSKYSNDFDSHAANLEYAVLSSMLHGQTPPSDHNSAHTPSTSFPDFGPPHAHHQPPTSSTTTGGSHHHLFETAAVDASPGAFGASLEGLFTNTPNDAASLDPRHNSQGDSATANGGAGAPPSDANTTTNSYPYPDPKQRSSPSRGRSDAPSEAAQTWSGPPVRSPCGAMRTQDVYKEVNKPYPYAQSYHVLIGHLKERFEKTDILRIVRALAVFRPSLIALQMPLTEEDEVFVERCFQRTLIEFEKLISFSGTPTVCWRRTGEICLVGIEFSFLTKWDRSDLVGEGKKRFIFELFDTSSCVEYYESFAKHAFENSTQTIMSTCVLLTPDQKPVPCSFCFTIKRDMFNCPSLVVGQFLPLLLA